MSPGVEPQHAHPIDTLWNLVRWSNVSVLEGNRREAFRTTLPELLHLAALKG